MEDDITKSNEYYVKSSRYEKYFVVNTKSYHMTSNFLYGTAFVIKASLLFSKFFKTFKRVSL